MVNMTGSFVSPSADATISPQLFAPAGLVASILDGLTVWKLILTLFVAAVIYDQCKSKFLRNPSKNVSFARSEISTRPGSIANHVTPFVFANNSQVPLPEGQHRWSCLQDPLHGPFPPVCQSQVHRVQGEMGQW